MDFEKRYRSLREETKQSEASERKRIKDITNKRAEFCYAQAIKFKKICDFSRSKGCLVLNHHQYPKNVKYGRGGSETVGDPKHTDKNESIRICVPPKRALIVFGKPLELWGYSWSEFRELSITYFDIKGTVRYSCKAVNYRRAGQKYDEHHIVSRFDTEVSAYVVDHIEDFILKHIHDVREGYSV